MKLKPKPKRRADAESGGLRLFLSEPGLSRWLLKELKHRDVVRQKARPLTLFFRNYDALILPASQAEGSAKASRLILHAMDAPVFGSYKISDRQLDTLAAFCLRERIDTMTATAAGKAFDRRDLGRWVAKRLADRGVALRASDEGRNPLRLMILDEKYYFAVERFNYHDALGRKDHASRSGALPPTIGAAMAFIASPRPGEVIFDPCVGSGGLLAEAVAQSKGAVAIGADLDVEALKLARKTLGAKARLVQADSIALDLERRDITLTVANLQVAKRHGDTQTTAELYAGIIANAHAHRGEGWRMVALTSDKAAMQEALKTVDLNAEIATDVKIRGVEAWIWLIRA